MAHLPARAVGGLKLLLERLESGTAEAGDQRWAAKLLRLAKASPRITERGLKERRDWGVFHDVERLKASGMEPTLAYKEVAKTMQTAYYFRDSGGGPRGMGVETVKGIYLSRKRLSEELEEWAESNPELAHPDGFED